MLKWQNVTANMYLGTHDCRRLLLKMHAFQRCVLRRNVISYVPCGCALSRIHTTWRYVCTYYWLRIHSSQTITSQIIQWPINITDRLFNILSSKPFTSEGPFTLRLFRARLATETWKFDWLCLSRGTWSFYTVFFYWLNIHIYVCMNITGYIFILHKTIISQII